jgi:hypothetical protein
MLRQSKATENLLSVTDNIDIDCYSCPCFLRTVLRKSMRFPKLRDSRSTERAVCEYRIQAEPRKVSLVQFELVIRRGLPAGHEVAGQVFIDTRSVAHSPRTTKKLFSHREA